MEKLDVGSNCLLYLSYEKQLDWVLSSKLLRAAMEQFTAFDTY